MAVNILLPTTTAQTQTMEGVSPVTRITGVFFDFDNTLCVAGVSFGEEVDGVFNTHYSEMWMLSGPFYETVVDKPVSSQNSKEDLLMSVMGVVVDVQTTDGKKEALQASGELVLVEGTLAPQLTREDRR